LILFLLTRPTASRSYTVLFQSAGFARVGLFAYNVGGSQARTSKFIWFLQNEIRRSFEGICI